MANNTQHFFHRDGTAKYFRSHTLPHKITLNNGIFTMDPLNEVLNAFLLYSLHYVTRRDLQMAKQKLQPRKLAHDYFHQNIQIYQSTDSSTKT